MLTQKKQSNIVDVGYRTVGILLIFIGFYFAIVNGINFNTIVAPQGWGYEIMSIIIGLALTIIPLIDDYKSLREDKKEKKK